MQRSDDTQASFVETVGRRLLDVLSLVSPEEMTRRMPPAFLDTLECFCSGGKRARPRLVCCLGRAVCAPRDALVDVAVAAELIHAASLLHDDVLDRALRRRGRETLRSLFGDTPSVLAGDLLLTRALGQLQHHAPVMTADAIETVDEMSRSALSELRCRGRLDLGLAEWRRIAEGKTGALFAFCGRAAARLGGAGDAVPRFDAFGRHAGVAFQLTDDLLDLRADSRKDRFADLRNREATSLLVHAAALPDVGERLHRFWRASGDETVEAIGAAISASAAPLQMVTEIVKEVDLALAALGPYRGLPGCVELEGWTRSLEKHACAFIGAGDTTASAQGSERSSQGAG